MKKIQLAAAIASVLMLSSCGTLFTSSRQQITFVGLPGTQIYDNASVVTKIDEGGTGTANVRKRLSDKTFIAKQEGYRSTPLVLESTLNPVSILNLTNLFAWAIDLASGKCCKWDNTVIEFEMEPVTPPLKLNN